MTQQTGTGNRDPRVVEAINEAIKLEASGQTGLAIALLESLVQQFPGVASIRAYLAWFLSSENRFREAIEHGREAVHLSPRLEKTSLVLFHVLWKAGQQSQAIDEARRFLTIRTSSEYSAILDKWEAGEKVRESGESHL